VWPDAMLLSSRAKCLAGRRMEVGLLGGEPYRSTKPWRNSKLSGPITATPKNRVLHLFSRTRCLKSLARTSPASTSAFVPGEYRHVLSQRGRHLRPFAIYGGACLSLWYKRAMDPGIRIVRVLGTGTFQARPRPTCASLHVVMNLSGRRRMHPTAPRPWLECVGTAAPPCHGRGLAQSRCAAMQPRCFIYASGTSSGQGRCGGCCESRQVAHLHLETGQACRRRAGHAHPPHRDSGSLRR